MALGPVESGPPVKNAPYSAEATTEVVQPLVDGNRIVRRTTALLYRDSRGWTRREVKLGDIAGIVITGETVRAITIHDPDSGVTYFIDPDHRSTTIRPPEPGQPASGGPGRPLGPPTPLPGPTRQQQTDLTPGLATRVDALGTREIEGVHAEGTRRTVTIAAGVIGNERPIDTVTERWFSPELRIVVMSRQTDPRFGETTYRVTKITRTEPPAKLFEVPADSKPRRQP